MRITATRTGLYLGLVLLVSAPSYSASAMADQTPGGWHTNLSKAKQVAAKSGKPLLVYVFDSV